ncbi:hypothetical protein [Kitasatospora aburaviensis]|uniref:Uncharacterized protein n=1 Tax=Kitasatospora aburaviensis TaxID=67265 RepID=A0ABW1F0I2_9ACTN
MELAVPEVGAAVFEDAPLLVASLGRVADEEAVGLGLAEGDPSVVGEPDGDVGTGVGTVGTGVGVNVGDGDGGGGFSTSMVGGGSGGGGSHPSTAGGGPSRGTEGAGAEGTPGAGVEGTPGAGVEGTPGAGVGEGEVAPDVGSVLGLGLAEGQGDTDSFGVTPVGDSSEGSEEGVATGSVVDRVDGAVVPDVGAAVGTPLPPRSVATNDPSDMAPTSGTPSFSWSPPSTSRTAVRSPESLPFSAASTLATRSSDIPNVPNASAPSRSGIPVVRPAFTAPCWLCATDCMISWWYSSNRGASEPHSTNREATIMFGREPRVPASPAHSRASDDVRKAITNIRSVPYENEYATEVGEIAASEYITSRSTSVQRACNGAIGVHRIWPASAN